MIKRNLIGFYYFHAIPIFIIQIRGLISTLHKKNCLTSQNKITLILIFTAFDFIIIIIIIIIIIKIGLKKLKIIKVHKNPKR